MTQKRRQELVDLRSQDLDRDKRIRLQEEPNDPNRELSGIGQEYDDAIAEVRAAEPQDIPQHSGPRVHDLKPSVARTKFDKVPDTPQLP